MKTAKTIVIAAIFALFTSTANAGYGANYARCMSHSASFGSVGLAFNAVFVCPVLSIFTTGLEKPVSTETTVIPMEPVAPQNATPSASPESSLPAQETPKNAPTNS